MSMKTVTSPHIDTPPAQGYFRPVDPLTPRQAAVEALRHASRVGASASSVHRLGQKARRFVDDAIIEVRKYLGKERGGVVFCATRSEAKRLTHGLGPDVAIVVDAEALGALPGLIPVWFAEGVCPRPLWYGGGQQDGIRPGTVPAPLCAALAAALRIQSGVQP